MAISLLGIFRVKELVKCLRGALSKPTQVRNKLVHEVHDDCSVSHAKTNSVKKLFEEGSESIGAIATLLDGLEKELGFQPRSNWSGVVQKEVQDLKQKNILQVFEDFERLQAVDDGKPVHIPFQKCDGDFVDEKVKAVEKTFFPAANSRNPIGSNGVRIQVLTGMFGIGKSTTASSYAWQCVKDKRYVCPLRLRAWG